MTEVPSREQLTQDNKKQIHVRLHRIQARFTELIEMEAFSPEEQKLIAAHIDECVSERKLGSRDLYRLAYALHVSAWWIRKGEPNPREILTSAPCPYPLTLDSYEPLNS